ncbi:Amidohydrolase family protein [Salix suchowensis]|nr:Amidohydrolase family protein [Salix suchowensis]
MGGGGRGDGEGSVDGDDGNLGATGRDGQAANWNQGDANDTGPQNRAQHEPHDEEQNSAHPRELPTRSDIPHIQLSLEFIKLLKNAKLDSVHSGLTASQIDALRNPGPVSEQDFDANLRFSMALFLASLNASEDTYKKNYKAVHDNVNGFELLSYEKLKTRYRRSGAPPAVLEICDIELDEHAKYLLRCAGITAKSTNMTILYVVLIIWSVINGEINDNDTLMLFSIDGTQLYRMKQSDCWIYIWVILNLAPDKRYKLRLVFVTADCIAMVEITHWVGHHGRYSCRIFCGLPGRHKAGAPHYYISLLKPDNYNVPGSSHPDIDITNLPSGSNEEYLRLLMNVIQSHGPTQFMRRRCDNGLSSATIFLGLNLALPIPLCFTGDIMHLEGLNIPQFMIGLWRGGQGGGSLSVICATTDSRRDWDWAVLADSVVWDVHGSEVADSTEYLPGCFEHPPRDPSEKISSGYKATEFLTYLYGLCPGLLYEVLPHAYWKSFCKLVCSVRYSLNNHFRRQSDTCSWSLDVILHRV